MANSNASIEALLGSLLSSHVASLLQSISVTPQRPIGQFSIDGASIFVIYGNNGVPLGYGVSRSSSSAASRNQTSRLIEQLASTGVVSTYKSIAIPSDDLVDVIGRMIGGLLGSALLTIGDGLNGDGAAAPARRGRRPGRPAGSGKGSRKGRGGRPRKVAASDVGEAAAGGDDAPRRRGRRPGSKNKPRTVAGKRGPGRPRKDASATPEGAVPVKRGPGRPKKNVESDMVATPTKRRGGRPKGSKNRVQGVKRGPGRPRKTQEGGEG